MANAQALIAKIQVLPPNRLSEVEDFVEFIVACELWRTLTRAAAEASVSAFAAVWKIPTTTSRMPYEFGDVVLVPSITSQLRPSPALGESESANGSKPVS